MPSNTDDKIIHRVTTVQYTKQDVIDIVNVVVEGALKIIDAIEKAQIRRDAADTVRKVVEDKDN
jgi:hypothetical protein